MDPLRATRRLMVQLCGGHSSYQGIQPIDFQLSFEEVFYQLDMSAGYELCSVHLMDGLDSTSAVIHSQLNAIVGVEIAEVAQLSRSIVNTIRFNVRKKAPVAPVVCSAATALMAAGQRARYVDATLVATWFKAHTNKGQVGQDVACWMSLKKIYFSDEHTPAVRKDVVLAIIDVVYQISDSLKKSLATDLSTHADHCQKSAVQSIWHSAGKPRATDPGRDASCDKLLKAVKHLDDKVPSR